MNKQIKNIHFGGIGGCGISALAQIALRHGYRVTGSDIAASQYTRKLQSLGIPIFFGHREENIKGADLIVNSAAIEMSNPEVRAARKLGIPIVKHSQFLGQLMKHEFGICVAGTHGKTTTDALIGLCLVEAGLDPTIEIGGSVSELQGNVRVGKSQYFVAESCEFNHSFLNLFPRIGIVLNIEEDHPDYYPNLETLKKAFVDFLDLVPAEGSIILRNESEAAREVLAKTKSAAQKVTVGFNKTSDWWAENVDLKRNKTDFEAFFRGKSVGNFRLSILGRLNVQNALVALAVLKILDVDLENARAVFKKFHGVDRRFEVVYKNNFEVVSDYAHHPAQIRATIEAAKQQTYRRLVVVFQPHTYSRTQYLFNEFIHAFDGADRLLIAETYLPAGRHEKILPQSSSLVLAEKIGELQAGVEYTGNLTQTVKQLESILQKGDLVLIVGAGDIYQIADSVKRIKI